MMRWINLTPHALNIRRADGSMLVLPPSGTVARCAAATTAVGTVDGVTITRTVIDPATVEGLPRSVAQLRDDLANADLADFDAPTRAGLARMIFDQRDTAFIVSRIVRDAVPDRDDVYCPGPALRDAEGRIVGCDGLSL